MRMVVVAVVVLLGADGFSPANADSTWMPKGKVFVGGGVGAGHFPMSEWEDFWSSFSRFYYDSERLSPDFELFAGYRVTDKHALKLSVEWLTVRASLFYATIYTSPAGSASDVITWDFRTIPVSLSYEFSFKTHVSDASGYLGAGVGYYFTRLEAALETLHDDVLGPGRTEVVSDDRGYGFHLYVGARSRIHRGIFMYGQLRGRFADGRALTDSEGDISIKFSGVDISLGVEWTI